MDDAITEHLNRLFSTAIPLTGNTGKVRALVELSRLIDSTNGLSILDIGCIGPNPLDFWRPLFALYDGRFQLTGIDPDAQGIARVQARVHEFSAHPITLLPGSGYDLTRLFPGQSFDVIVFTQVLEHVRQYGEFLEQVQRVSHPAGHILFTLDSAHYPRRRPLAEVVKDLLARLGQEHRYRYEHGRRDDEIDPVLDRLGLTVLAREFYCTSPAKRLHNHYLHGKEQNDLLRLWFAHEYFVNTHITFDGAAKSQFLILFYHARWHE